MGYRQIAGISLNAGMIPERPYHGRPMHPLLGSIPSPSSGNLGPFHMYGVILAVGVLVGVYVAEQRWRRRGYPRDGIYDISFWVVIWGVIGARLYHVVTDYQLFEDDPLRALQIWRGGLGIWGAVLGGAIAVIVITRRRHMQTLAVMDCMAPGIVLAQAIGRWGNYFNQELFGKPSTLPWALEIAPSHRPAGYVQYTTFQPTFLYESLACLAICGILLLVERRAASETGSDVRAVRRALHLCPILVREHADRSRARDRRHACERLGLARGVRARRRLVRVARSPRGTAAAPRTPARCRSIGAGRRGRRRRVLGWSDPFPPGRIDP